MKSIFYLSFILPNSNKGAGVYKKILSQVSAFEKQGIKVYLGVYETIEKYNIICNGEIIRSCNPSQNNFIKREADVVRFVSDFCIENDIDFLYSRWERFSISAYLFYKRMKKNGVRVILEIPTYPLTQRRLSIKSNFKEKKYKEGIKRCFAMVNNSLGIPLMKKAVIRIANNNNYDRIWKIPVLKMTNAIDASKIELIAAREDDGILKMIAVANVEDWHGYDRLIYGIEQFKRNHPGEKVSFTIVGVGDGIPKLKEIVSKLSLEENILFVGFKTGESLADEFGKADIGVSVLGVHRAGMNYCDSLKSREYCARTIPFITEITEKMYLECPFVLKVSEDDTPINVAEVVKFKKRLYKNIVTVKKEMRSFAENECSYEKALNPVFEFINE